MRGDSRQGALLDRSPGLALGLAASAAAVTLSTLVIYPLNAVADVQTLGVVYLVGVVIVASLWGLGLGLLLAVVSALVFNYVHLPPVHEFVFDDAEDVVSIVVFVVAAVAASAMADRARRQAAAAEARRQEADLAAELARLLLGGTALEESVAAASRRFAELTGLPGAWIELGEAHGGLPLTNEGRRVGTLVLPDDAPAWMRSRIEARVAPTLAALLDAAVERDRLVGEVVDTRAQARAAEQARAQHDAARALAEASTLEEAAPRIVEAIGGALGWDMGVLWQVDEPARALRAAAYWTRSADLAAAHPREVVERARPARGEALAGGVWQSRAPVWVSDLAQDPRFDLPVVGGRLGMRAALAVPIEVSGQCVGVLEFFAAAARHRDPEQLGAAVAIAGYVGQFVARRRAELELVVARDRAIDTARFRSDFLANMSHEIRTPMNGVLGMTQLLLDTPLTPEQRGFAETLRGSGEALLTIIDDILDLSKLEAGKLELDSTEFDVRETVADVCELLGARAAERGVELAIRIDDAVPPAIRADEGRLRQVLTNLVGNAIKFTQDGDVVVTLGARPRGPSEAELRVEVADTGIGIEPARIDALFESFSQADASTTRRYGGTGLGLAISRQLVELMGGEIGAESEPGRGSTFRFSARVGIAAAPPERHDGPLRALAGMRVLVVDDNAVNRDILERQIASWRMEAASAGDGAAGLEELRAAAAAGRGFELVLLDFRMPGMDGLEVARALRADPALADVRVILLTSAGEQRRQARAAGIALTLSKPVRQSSLHDAIVSVMNGGAAVVEVAEPAPAVGAAELGGAPVVLLAEDNAVNQAVAVNLLHRRGYRVDVVENGREAVDAVERGGYAAVLMDCQMPELDGYEATREIRRREGGGRHTPVIAMTAHAMEGDRERCLAAGMDDFLTKPVVPDDLVGALERWISADGGGVLDRARLDSLRAGVGGEAIVDRILDTFIARGGETVDAIATAVGAGDAAAAARAAHSLKGSAATVGAAAVAEIAGSIEELGRGGRTPEPGDVDRLRDAFARTREAVRAL